MAHVDLLFASRRLWKLRFDSCRLVDLEHQILGVEREGDLPGEMIPYVYFEYLRTLEAFRLVPIFHHNAMDILTLACLTAIVPCAFQSPQNAPLTNGAEMIGLARWLRKAARYDLALDWFRRAIERGLSDELLFRTLWDIAALEKRRGCETAALATFRELAASRNPWRIAALEELAKFYEHREANLATALEFTEQALGIEENEKLRRRATRLKKRLESPRVGRLNLMA
ncbi:MAG TPA: ribonuclease H-like domain-containing protein, partial [Terriglobales bacterium]